MRLEIDTAVCTGHGRCYTRSPKLISPDDEGYPVLLHADGEVPADAQEDARLAARSCPEGAMRLLEAG
jgi:ferredoxin